MTPDEIQEIREDIGSQPYSVVLRMIEHIEERDREIERLKPFEELVKAWEEDRRKMDQGFDAATLKEFKRQDDSRN